MRYDIIRIAKVENGWVISARKDGETPQSYAYTEKRVAKTVGEVKEVIAEMLSKELQP